MTESSSTKPDERSDMTATQQKMPLCLHGRLIGSLQGAAAGAESVAVLRDVGSGDVLADSRISPDGSFAMAELPEILRGRSLKIDVIVADPGGGGPNTAISNSVDIPLTGDASVVVHRGTFGSDAESLSPSPEVLGSARFDA